MLIQLLIIDYGIKGFHENGKVSGLDPAWCLIAVLRTNLVTMLEKVL